jgi:hypothetical protein
MNLTIFSFWQMSDVDKANYLIENGQSSRDHLEALARKLANKAGDWHNCLPNWGSHQFYNYLCRIVDAAWVED